MEFALALPVFLFLALGVVEFGWLLFVYSQTYNASREAARYGAAVVNWDDANYCENIKAAAVRVGNFGGVQTSSVEIKFDNSATEADDLTWNKDNAFAGDFKDCASPPDVELGDRIIVRVSVGFDPLIGIIPDSTVVNTALRTVIFGVEVSDDFDPPPAYP